MVRVERSAIIGVGLLGGSLALALKKYGISREVWGTCRKEKNLKNAVERGIIDSYSLSYTAVVKDADLVVLATPVGAFKEITQKMIPSLKKGSIVTDVGSVKGELVRELEGMMPEGVAFVGGHPIAGSERLGIETATSDLFIGARCIITPTEKTPEGAVKTVKEIWRRVGANVVVLTPEEHDFIFALVSHLPHIISYTLINTVSAVNPDYIEFAGTGFKDTTRVALSSPELWVDICMENKNNLLRLLEKFQECLADMLETLKIEDHERLKTLLQKAKRLREKI